MALINAGSFAAAKTGTNLPGSFNQTHPNNMIPVSANKPSAPAAKSPAGPTAQNPTNTNTNNNNGNGNNVAAGPTAAQIAQQQQQQAAHDTFNSGLSAIHSGVNDKVGTGAGDYNAFIDTFFNGAGGIRSQQNNINNEGVQNDLSKIQGMQDINDMVNNGINGAGVILDNDGAGTSSAGGAIARAYGVQARQQASKVGSQYAQGQNQIDTEQGNLADQINSFKNVQAPTHKADLISQIVDDTQSKLNNLNYMATVSGIGDRADIMSEIAATKAQGTAALSALDGSLASDITNNAPTSADANSAKAMQLHTAGTAPAHQFDYTTTAPAQLQDSGPSASPLPIFVGSQNKNNNLPIA